MTKPRIIPQEEFAGFAAGLMEQARVLAPVRQKNDCAFDWISKPSDPDFTCANPLVSPKQAFFPRSDVLFFFQKNKAQEEIIAPLPPSPQIVLGIHPCDVYAVEVLDAVFAAAPVSDQIYMERRRQTTLVGRAFLNDAPSEFFRELGIDPLDSHGCDLFLFPLPDGRWFLEVLTDKGSALESAYAGFAFAGQTECDAVAEARHGSAKRVSREPGLDKIKRKLDLLFESDFWQPMHSRCVGCGACAFLCPTCHCFEIRDEMQGAKGARMRVWDTCQFDLFTRHASGHNPRNTQKERTRQRVMHKFSYGLEKFGIPFCVGCGRCVVGCPVNNDMRQTFKYLMELPGD